MRFKYRILSLIHGRLMVHVPEQGAVMVLPSCGVSPYWSSTALPFRAGGMETRIGIDLETGGVAADVANCVLPVKEPQTALA